MIKRFVWFVTGLATGAGAVVVLGRRLRRRVASLTPVRVAERGVRRVRSVASNARDAFHEGVVAMRQREQELRTRVGGRSSESLVPRISKDSNVSKDANVISLRDPARSSSTRGR